MALVIDQYRIGANTTVAPSKFIIGQQRVDSLYIGVAHRIRVVCGHLRHAPIEPDDAVVYGREVSCVNPRPGVVQNIAVVDGRGARCADAVASIVTDEGVVHLERAPAAQVHPVSTVVPEKTVIHVHGIVAS